MYIGVPRETVALVDTGRTETVQHHVSQALGRKKPHQPFNQFQCSCRHLRRSSVLEIPAPFRTRVSRSCNLVGLAIRA